jgi:hypothetical protein
MEKFISLWFGRLPNVAHYNFFTNVKAAIDASPSVVTDALGDNIGMANLTIHWQGKYKGAKTTTFMIAR